MKRGLTFFVRPLIDWFSRYPLLFIIAFLLEVILAGAGSKLGVPSLFWHEKASWQFTAGLSVSWLFNEICFIGFLLDQQATQRVEQNGEFDRYYGRTFLILVIIAIVVGGFYKQPMYGIPLLSALLIGLLVFWFGTRWSIAHFRVFYGFSWVAKLEKLKEADLQTIKTHVLAAVSFGLFLIAYLALFFSLFFISPGVLPPSLSVCLILILLVQIYGFVVFHWKDRSFGIFAAVILVLAILPARPHRFADMHYKIDLRTKEASAGDVHLLTDSDVLKNWAANRPGRPLFIVSVSGGGIRAATWAVSMLCLLENAIPNFPSDTRIITGASGGMLGAALYTADYERRRLKHEGMTLKHREELVQMIASDSLSAATSVLALRDIPLGAFWFIDLPDRGAAMEDAWRSHTQKLLDTTFKDLHNSEEAGQIPSLIFSPMIAEDGRRLLISNLDLEFLTAARARGVGVGGTTDVTYSISAIQFFRRFPQEASRLPLSTASRMNATFPYISPASELPTRQERHIVDAGYYDNYGINNAALWIFHHIQDLPKYAPYVVLIQIRDQSEEINRLNYVNKQEHKLKLPWLMTPVRAFLGARSGAMSYRNDEALSSLSKIMNDSTRDYFKTVTFEYSQSAALSWYLTRKEITDLTNDAMLGENGVKLNQLKSWAK